jgi:hypothetical protein
LVIRVVPVIVACSMCIVGKGKEMKQAQCRGET